MKKLLSIAICIAVILSLTSCTEVKRIGSGLWGFVDRDIENYEEKRLDTDYASDYMPTLGELGDYTDASYSYQYTTMILFESKAISLFVEYSDAHYGEKKNEILSSYVFLEETMLSAGGENYQSAPASFEYGGYNFRTSADLEFPNYESCACKSFALIGLNDDKKRIAFCYYYDADLDTFGSTSQSEEAMITEFIDDYFDWNDLP